MQAITSFGAFTKDTADRLTRGINDEGGSGMVAGTRWWVDPLNGNNAGRDGLSAATAFATITYAESVAEAGDEIVCVPGDYDEAVVINTSNLTLRGLGGRGAVAIAPSATNGIAITISGTAASRTANVTLINIGGEGNGTGGGLYVFGNIRRIRTIGCKFEGGAFGTKLESTAAGSVGDTRIVDCELAWATTGLHLLTSGGGDPVTQTYVAGNLLHNLTADGIKTSVSHAADLWIEYNTFANQEDGTEPTRYLDIDDAGTTGFVTKNSFATTVLASAKMAIASGVIWAGNQVQAEGAATGGGTSGRPD